MVKDIDDYPRYTNNEQILDNDIEKIITALIN